VDYLQLKRLLEEQPPPDGPEPDPPDVAKPENWRSTFGDWQAGHSMPSSLSRMERNFSNLLPHWAHRYS
jgi:hypothetical protein